MKPEHESSHSAHGTGYRWLDLTLALSAMFVSVVSLAVAVHHGNAMDRLVAANSWPFLMYSTSNKDAQGQRFISLNIENVGVGPARVQTFEVWWQGEPVPTAEKEPAFGLDVVQAYRAELGGLFWYYQGETLGYRCIFAYWPQYNLVMTVATNSQPPVGTDQLGDFVLGKVLQILTDASIVAATPQTGPH